MSSRPPNGSERPSGIPSSGLQLITFSDIFVLVDHGTALPAEYVALGKKIASNAAAFPGGIGGLAIVVRDAPPPSKPVRAAIRGVLERLGPSLRCHCWLVEGAGFQGAMVRGVLTSLRMIGSFPFESHVTSELPRALEWILRRLDGGEARLGEIDRAVRWIEQQRRDGEGAGESH
jgi:hypothetical protein